MLSRTDPVTGKTVTAQVEDAMNPTDIQAGYRIAQLEEEVASLKLQLEMAIASGKDIQEQYNGLRAALKMLWEQTSTTAHKLGAQ